MLQKYSETSDVKDALSAVYDVVVAVFLFFCFGSHDLRCTRIENTFCVVFGPRGSYLKPTYASVIIPPCNSVTYLG